MNAKTSGMLALAIAAGMVSSANAATVTPALPGGATNLFSGLYDIGSGGTWNGSDPGRAKLTDQDLDTFGNSTYEGGNSSTPSADVRVAVFAATPGTSGSVSNASLGTISGINTIRIWAQASFTNNNDLSDSYVDMPGQVSIKYDWKTANPGPTNPEDYNGVNSSNFSSDATILAVNGVATNSTTVSLTSAIWTANGPTIDTVGDSDHRAYYVDLTVDIPTTNAVFFDFGVQPTRASNGYGGMYVNEIQAAAVPEPVSLSLIALVAPALLSRRMRRSK